jgi:hypothetical protein
MTSYISSNVLSAGDYHYEKVFYGLPEDEYERSRYRHFMQGIQGTRYFTVSRTTERDEELEVETSVFVMPSVQWIADVLAFLPSLDRNGESEDAADYYSVPSEYYEAVISGGVSVPSPVTESYHAVVHGLSKSRRGVVESVAGVRYANGLLMSDRAQA